MAIQVTSPRKFYGIIGLVLFVVLLVSFRWLIAGAVLEKDGDFAIESGTSSRAVWSALAAEGFTGSELPWKYYSWRQEAADKIQAGTYHLTIGQPVSEVVTRFINGDTTENELTLTYPEGFTLEQIAARTAERGIGTKEEFMQAVSSPAQFAEEFSFVGELPEGRTLEGYLFPDTYRVFEDDTSLDVIRRMLTNFDRRIVQSGLAAGTDRTLDEMVNMASILEREVQTDDDMAVVAGILWKRLDDGEGLYVDATIRYALNKPTAGLTVADLAIDSPYNTRKYRGLPPGPISNPGLRALTAAIKPEASEYYYYLSAPSGETIFAETNDEHNRNKAEHLQ
ncbi:MAG: endolytic transglycosylase MltG [Candidatus Andersenbacteria bacterium]|nr:endolytic transglycosylase MltG [Candidatus Andersenbacteria bacterium]MBI3250471.1 endolytic transglycosylase MltG [Candidatus Andersenbacteria bacterium]